MAMVARSSLFKSNRSQAVRLPKDIAFPDGVKQVVLWRKGNARVIAPADALWDDFFADPGIDLAARDQPEAQEREAL
jgi:antitoxin VapB